MKMNWNGNTGRTRHTRRLQMPETPTKREIVEDIFGEEAVTEFTNDAIGYFSTNLCSSFTENDTDTAKIYEILKRSIHGSVLSKLTQSYLIACPHSMITERVISSHTETKTDERSCLTRETMNDMLTIS